MPQTVLPLIEPYGTPYTYGPPRTYGYPYLIQYNVEPFVAQSVSYETILLTWKQPQGTITNFRLIANRYGFPVDQNDGDILLSSTTYFGSQYADQNLVPGTYHYYAIYVQRYDTGAWVRAGFAACLAVNIFNSGSWLFNHLPSYFQSAEETGALTITATGDLVLQQFLNVIGFGLDYLKTQYAALADHLNDPMFIPIDDLYNLANELGINFQPEIPAPVMRKAVQNWTHVMQERGTPTGIANHITLLTGYGVDLRRGNNLMLEQDQSSFTDPSFAPWTANLAYNVGEMVTSGTGVYNCIAVGNQGFAPPNATYWSAVTTSGDPNFTLANTKTIGNVNTWEMLYPGVSTGVVPAASFKEVLGVEDPLNISSTQANALQAGNTSGSPQAVYVRSVSRISTDIAAGAAGLTSPWPPDAIQPILDGVPLPNTLSTDVWSPAVRYATDSIVSFNGIPFKALRASTGAQPPAVGVPLNTNYSFEAGSTLGWLAVNNATIAASSAQVFQGTESCLVTPNGTTANPGVTSAVSSIASGAIMPNGLFAGTPWVYVGAGWNSVSPLISWIDEFGNIVGTPVAGTAVNVAASTWTRLAVSGTAPATAAGAQLTVYMSGTPSGATTMYVDLAGLSCWATPEWVPLSKDSRIRFMISGYCSQNLTLGSNYTSPVTPVIELFSRYGKLISKVVARTPTAGTAAPPTNYTFDSFTTAPNTPLQGRMSDTDDQTWLTVTGAYTTANGLVIPASSGTRCISLLTGPNTTSVPANISVSFSTLAATPQTQGIVFRYSGGNYLFATATTTGSGTAGLWQYSGGTYTQLGAYTSGDQFAAGDRMTVILNGTSITVQQNGNSIGSFTSAFNQTATQYGIGVDTV